ncbi:hypothetical protein BHE74_00056369 [Ensete ventricosum]|nr:hypothetical protein BHE74_00056369 [Ensete ventricosum]RZR93075.1 hypothetical protein BHM03_00021465 [Ensete ventricosum]
MILCSRWSQALCYPVAATFIPTVVHSSVLLLPPSQRSPDPRHSPFLLLPAAFHHHGPLMLSPAATLPPSSSYASSLQPAATTIVASPHRSLSHYHSRFYLLSHDYLSAVATSRHRPLLFNRLSHIAPKRSKSTTVVSSCFPAVASSSSNSIENKESLKASVVVCKLPNVIEAEIHDFLADGVVTSDKVVQSIFLATDYLFRVEKLAISSSSYFIDNSGFHIDKDYMRNVLSNDCSTR